MAMDWDKVRRENLERQHGVRRHDEVSKLDKLADEWLVRRAWERRGRYGRERERRGEHRMMPTKGEAKKRLVDEGVGMWTMHNGEWCVRIAGRFNAGDTVSVMSNSGRKRLVVLGEAVPNTHFRWPDSAGQLVDGQLFRRRGRLGQHPVSKRVPRQ